jgi:hypothetical protein
MPMNMSLLDPLAKLILPLSFE